MSFLGLSRPARSAGLALLAVGVIAAVIGGIMLATGDGGDNVAEPGPSSAPGGGPPPGGATTEPGAPSASSGSQAPTSQAPGSGESSAPGSPAPPSGPGEAGAGGADGTDGTDGAAGGRNGGPRGQGSANGQVRESDVPVRVYNNSNVKNLASRAASDLRKQGWTVAEVSNYPYGVIPATTAYYRKGTPEKAAALSLAAAFGMRAEPRFDGIKDASPGVVIIVTKNYHGPVGKSG